MSNNQILNSILKSSKELTNLSDSDLTLLENVVTQLNALKTENFHPLSVYVINECRKMAQEYGSYNSGEWAWDVIRENNLIEAFTVITQEERIKIGQDLAGITDPVVVIASILSDLEDKKLLPPDQIAEIRKLYKYY